MVIEADTLWLATCTILVFFMQAGFAMLETGFTRNKNSGNIIMKNVADFSVGSLCYWIAGFGIMFGFSLDLFARGDYSSLAGNVPQSVFMAWQLVFCATSATIVSGAMAERTNFKAYLIYSALMSAFIYPMSGSWIWNPNGWLAKMGFHDFAGGTAVHLLGGASAFAGALMIGPRIGKYDKNKNSRAIRGQNIQTAAIGVFILWVAWFGFNGGSVVGSGEFDFSSIGNVFMNTIISSAACSLTSMIITWMRYGKSDITMTLNGIVAGLVAITPGADLVSPIGSLIIGILAAFVLVWGIELIDLVLKVDDPVGAITVHGLCGAYGTIMTGIFSKTNGLLYSGRANFLGVQMLGVLVVLLYAVVVMSVIFFVLKHTCGLRVSVDEEIEGLDKSEHGFRNSYGDFGVASTEYDDLPDEIDLKEPLDASKYVADGKIRKVVVLMNSNRFEALKDALDDIDITGMTVTHVSGCGIQRGGIDYYRGAESKSHLLPKLKVEIVISTVPLGLVIDTVKSVLHSGNIGDGKIFVYDVGQVIKIRTNEEGKMALE